MYFDKTSFFCYDNIMAMRHVVHTFPPVINKDSKVLILGSVPSQLSVRYNFYYMNSKNRFWSVMSALLKRDLIVLDAIEKSKILLDAGIALYDSVTECDIEGSDDGNIFNAVITNISDLIKDTQIVKIFTNGAASYRFAIKGNPTLKENIVLLPSTSPRNARSSLNSLIEKWKPVIEYSKCSKQDA